MMAKKKQFSQAKEEAVDLSKFLYSVDSSACNIRHVASTENLKAYLEKLRSCHVKSLRTN